MKCSWEPSRAWSAPSCWRVFLVERNQKRSSNRLSSSSIAHSRPRNASQVQMSQSTGLTRTHPKDGQRRRNDVFGARARVVRPDPTKKPAAAPDELGSTDDH